MNREPRIQFFFNPEDGVSMCVITNENKTFVGTAMCAEADRDMLSEKTGCEIARQRAIIKLFTSRRDELRVELAALKKFYYTVNQSQHYNENNYIAKMLQRKINQYTEDLKITKELLSEHKIELKNYLEQKAEVYNRIRSKRSKEDN